jgi:hypothetical protein
MSSPTEALIEKVRDEHVGLAVAAHYACIRLLAGPLRPYDVQHLNDMLELAGSALCKIAPLYVAGPEGAAPRRLTRDELRGARVLRGATRVVLRHGRNLSAVSIRRSDLRQASAVLKTLAIPRLAPRRVPFVRE